MQMITYSVNAVIEIGMMFLGRILVIVIKSLKSFILFYQVIQLLKIYSGEQRSKQKYGQRFMYQNIYDSSFNNENLDINYVQQ